MSVFKNASKMSVKSAFFIGSLTAMLMGSLPAQATIVQFQTSLGNFEVNLYDKATPETVANFLEYVKSGAYENNLIHRLVKTKDGENFVIQGGGYNFTGTYPPDEVVVRLDEDDIDSDGNRNEALHPANEPKFSNVRATLAMAKQDGDANSATSQWFINLNDNSEILDNQNGGFTVFGEVMGEGMAVIDEMATYQAFNMGGGAFVSFPLRNYSIEDKENNILVTEDNLIMITNIVVLDYTEGTADGLTPTPNTLVEENKGDDSSGSLGISSLFLLALLSFCRVRRSYNL